MLHCRREYAFRCQWCGEGLTDGEPNFVDPEQRNEWLASPDCCKNFIDVDLTIFDEEGPSCSFPFLSERIKITDELLEERLKRFTPLHWQGKGLKRASKVDPRTTSFTWEPRLYSGKVVFEESMVTPTFHHCNFHGWFKPSIAEVLAQVPDDTTINAFYIDTKQVRICSDGGGHIAATHWGRV